MIKDKIRFVKLEVAMIRMCAECGMVMYAATH